MDSSFQKGFFYVVLLFYIYIPFGEIALNEAWRKEKNPMSSFMLNVFVN